MAEVKPIHAVRYEPAVAGEISALVAPPYDVIDKSGRSRLLEQSPQNVVELDLPVADDDSDPYDHAATTFAGWRASGVLVAEPEPSLWALEQDYTDPAGERRTRRGFICRIRVTEYGAGRVRPHERTQPGPKQDRLDLTRATRHNLSPIFCLSDGDGFRHLTPVIDGADPWAEVTDADGTTHRVWPVRDPEAHAAVAAELADSELLIADGHHRYETARTYAEEVGGEGDHRYTLAALVALDDPGLTVFGYHRLLKDLSRDDEQALRDALERDFEIEQVSTEAIDPADVAGIGVFGLIDAHDRQAQRLTLRDPGRLAELMPDRSQAYRELDAAILEELVLKRALGRSDEEIEAKRGIGYVSSAAEALASLDSGAHQAAFIMRPTPVEQVRAVAAQGETMPPKSTYFFPKLMTGFVFNPLGGEE